VVLGAHGMGDERNLTMMEMVPGEKEQLTIRSEKRGLGRLGKPQNLSRRVCSRKGRSERD